MMTWLKKERRILLKSFAIGVFIAIGVAAYTFAYSAAIQRDIAQNVIRFHVVAHDNSPEEQDLKEYVRTSILQNFADTLSETTDIYRQREHFAEILPKLQQHAQEVVNRHGFKHTVYAQMATVFFPTQHYGNIVFPPGYYEAVQIFIGDGEGENWWCLMFPPLCYVDMTTTEAAHEMLYDAVSYESFRLLTHTENPSTELLVRFRVVEWWQNR